MADGEHQEKKTREAAAQDKALDSITDMVEDRELNEKKVNKAMQSLQESQAANREAQRLREKELAAVKIKKEDVELIATEFEVDEKVAERRLREHKGDVKSTLYSFLQ